MRLSILFAAITLASSTGEACPELSFGQILSEAKLDLSGRKESVSMPILIPSIGISRDGKFAGFSFGWGFGERQVGGLFPGTSVHRVLLNMRRTAVDDEPNAVARMTSESAPRSAISMALTYGWFAHVPSLFDAGIDVGVGGSSRSQLGPTAQITAGMAGFGVRLSGGVEFGDDTRVTAAAELVIDVIVLGQTIEN